MDEFIQDLNSRYNEALIYARRYTRLLILVMGAFVLASISLRYGSDIYTKLNPGLALQNAKSAELQPAGYWQLQSISQIGLAVLAIYFAQVIATYSKHFYSKALYYERLMLLWKYSSATDNMQLFTDELTKQPTGLSIGAFPKNPHRVGTHRCIPQTGR